MGTDATVDQHDVEGIKLKFGKSALGGFDNEAHFVCGDPTLAAIGKDAIHFGLVGHDAGVPGALERERQRAVPTAGLERPIATA